MAVAVQCFKLSFELRFMRSTVVYWLHTIIGRRLLIAQVLDLSRVRGRWLRLEQHKCGELPHLTWWCKAVKLLQPLDLTGARSQWGNVEASPRCGATTKLVRRIARNCFAFHLTVCSSRMLTCAF